MNKFIGKDFLLESGTAKKLYHGYAEGQPILDYHCHVSPREIWEDRKFENLTQMWLEGDHYKWRLMRTGGVEERYITGDAEDWEKFLAFAKVLPRAIGNPMVHWCHLELKNYFGYDGFLSEETAREIWELANEKLRGGGLSVRGLIEKSKVAFIGTTDDPDDSLEWHARLQAEPICGVTVSPTFRPDRLLRNEQGLSKQELLRHLEKRLDFFVEHACRSADHGTVRVDSSDTMTVALGQLYRERGIVMQLHFGAMRNVSSKHFAALGADSGFDVMGDYPCAEELARLLDAMDKAGGLPKTIVYSLNPTDNAAIDSVIGAFQGAGVAGKVQHGSAWWFNDTKQGMINQLTDLANQGILGNFVGMLTDSRSFLSYARHEYFRRILCNLIGGWMENGEYPGDIDRAGELITDICYRNAKAYFGL